MPQLKTETLCSWTLLSDDKMYFRSAMAKIYKEINKCGFSKKMGLTPDELEVFNDVVEQLSQQYAEDNSNL